MKVSLSYAHWSLRKWGRKIGKFLSFLQKKCFFLCEKKCILTYPMHLGVLGRSSLEPLLLRHLRFSEIFRLARFFKLRKTISWRILKFFADFAYFPLISQIKPAKHMRQLTYQDPSLQSGSAKKTFFFSQKERLKQMFKTCFKRLKRVSNV